MTDKRPDWDPLAPPALETPLIAQAELRERCPVAWTDRPAGSGPSRNTTTSSLRLATRKHSSTAAAPSGARLVPPLEVDRPIHTHFRRLLQPYFHKQRIAALEPQGARVGRRDAAAAARRRRRRHRACTHLPVAGTRACRRSSHLPDDSWTFLKAWSEELFENEEGRGNDPEKVQSANQRLYDYRAELVARRKADPLDPTDDLVTGLLQADGVTEDDVVQVLRLMLTAGHNSTTSALGICILAVARDAECPATAPRRAGVDPVRRRRVHAARDAGDGDAALGGA